MSQSICMTRENPVFSRALCKPVIQQQALLFKWVPLDWHKCNGSNIDELPLIPKYILRGKKPQHKYLGLTKVDCFWMTLNASS